MTKGDKILIILIVILSIVSIFIIKNKLNYGDKKIRIEINGKLYEEIHMYSIIDKEIRNIESEFGENTLEITSDYIRVTQASCPDKLDVKQGKISEVGEMIICLPNRLVIEIVGEDSEIDRLSR